MLFMMPMKRMNSFVSLKSYYTLIHFSFHVVIYFVALTVIGTYITVAFVISSFLGSFRKEFHQSVLKKTQLSRNGFFAGFAVLDIERIDRIEKRVLSNFHDKLTSSEEQAAQIQLSQKKEFLRKVVNLSAFVDAMEDHLFDINKIRSMEKLGHFDKEIMIERMSNLTLQNARRRSAFTNKRSSKSESSKKPSPDLEILLKSANWRRKLFVILAQPWVSRLVTLLVLLQTGALTFYGLVSSQFLDSLNLFFVVIFSIEIALKVVAYSPSAVSNFLIFVILI